MVRRIFNHWYVRSPLSAITDNSEESRAPSEALRALEEIKTLPSATDRREYINKSILMREGAFGAIEVIIWDLW